MAVTLIWTFGSVAFAAEDIFSAGSTQTVTLDLYESRTYTFTAPDNGVYAVSLSIPGNGAVEASVYYDDIYINGDFVMAMEVDDYSAAILEMFMQRTTDIYFCAEKDETFTVELCEMTGEAMDMRICLISARCSKE